MHQTQQKTSLHSTLKPTFNDVRVATVVGVIPDSFNGKTKLVTAYLHPVRHQFSSWHAAQNVKRLLPREVMAERKGRNSWTLYNSMAMDPVLHGGRLYRQPARSHQRPSTCRGCIARGKLTASRLENSENPRPAVAEMPHYTHSLTVILSYELGEMG